MSVIVKDMKMPKSCPCELVGVGYDVRCAFTYGVPSRVREYYECCEKETRPDWCPLIEVPTPHGRLIDADALTTYPKPIGKLMMFGGEYVYTQTAIDDAPTIIEADGT